MNEEVKVLNVTPVATTTTEEELQNTASAMQEAVDQFSEDEVEIVEDDKEHKAKSFLSDFRSYIKSSAFTDDVNEVSKKYNLPPKKVAQNFFEKALGTVGDILGIAINVVCSAGHMVINIVSTVCHSIVNLFNRIFNGIARVVTLNKTCVAN